MSITRVDSKTEDRFPQSLTLIWELPCSSSRLQPFFCGNQKNSSPQNAQNAKGGMITPIYTNFYTCIHPIPSQHITSNSHNLGRRSMSHLRKCQYPVLTRLFGGGGSRQPQITGYEETLVATIEPQSMHTIDDLPPWTLALLHARNILRAEEPARHNGLHFSLPFPTSSSNASKKAFLAVCFDAIWHLPSALRLFKVLRNDSSTTFPSTMFAD